MERLTPEAEALVERYLQRVADAMTAAGHPRDEVLEVSENLRDQVFEMAGRETGGEPATAAVVDSILGRLGDPAAFVAAPEATGPPPAASPSTPPASPSPAPPSALHGPASATWLGWLGLAATLGGLALAMLIGAWLPERDELPGAVLILSQLVALVAGTLARKTTAGRFALFCAVLVTLLLIAIVVFESSG
jgi:hypothetical protein